MLEHYDILLARTIFHQLLETSTKRIQQIDGRSLRHNFLLVREKTDPLEARNNASRLRGVRKCNKFFYLRDKSAEYQCPLVKDGGHPSFEGKLPFRRV